LLAIAILTLIETAEASVPFEVNDAVTIEVQDSSATYVNLFGGFITDLGITVEYSGSTALSQQIRIVAVGALARLNRAVYVGNFNHQFDGDRIEELLSQFYLTNGMKFQLLKLGMAMTLLLNGRMLKIAD
jgi:hypothetical protein